MDMHSYIIVGSDEEVKNESVEYLAAKLKLHPFEFNLAKIADVRQLGAFTKLSFSKPTAIILRDIDKATTEALNAFLKNLEEPQKNTTYILTATSIYKVLPTITSRCQIIRVNAPKKVRQELKVAQNYLQKTIPEKLAFLSQYKDREVAAKFVEKFIIGCHRLLLKPRSDIKLISKYLRSANSTLLALQANGNVNLQLTNFGISLGD